MTRQSWRDLFEEISVGEDDLNQSVAIDGVHFEPNRVNPIVGDEHYRIAVVRPSSFGEVGHFVTHASNFKYDTFGIHLGQMDRLTFFSRRSRQLKAFFVDCRPNSPSFGRRLSIKFSAALRRRLVIPCGVAHSFENLESVVTKNDLSLFVADESSGWSIANDDIVFPWTRKGLLKAPQVMPNPFPLSMLASLMFYRLQAQLLRGGQKEFGEELVLRIDGADRRVVVGRSTRARTGMKRRALTGRGSEYDLEPNCFGTVAKGSWSIIPGTESCVVDLLSYDVTDATKAPFSVFAKDRICLTALSLDGNRAEIELCDMRDSMSPRLRSRVISLDNDPRLRLRIDAGFGFRIRTPGQHLFRIEYLGPLPRLRAGKTRLDRATHVHT